MPGRCNRTGAAKPGAIRKNLKQNGFANRVIVIQRAIADHAETLGMIVTLHNFAGSEIARQPITRPEAIFRQPCETINVQATRLEDLVQSQQIAPRDVAFVWCDVQGSEGAVIRTRCTLVASGRAFVGRNSAEAHFPPRQFETISCGHGAFF